MIVKKISAFGLTLLLALVSLLVLTAPKAHAATSTGSPNTVFKLLASNPLVTMAFTIVATVTILLIARKYNKNAAKQ